MLVWMGIVYHHRPMLFITALMMALLTFVMPAYAVDLLSPLPARNLYPPMMRFFDPTPDSALRSYMHRWSVQVNQHYSTVNLMNRATNPGLLVDMELYVLDPVLRLTLRNQLELSLRVPLLFPGSGIFDSPIQRFHSWFNMPNGGRELRPNNRFAYRIDNAKGTRWQSRNRWQMGNVELSARYHLAGNAQWAIAALAAVKLPTASQSDGWGSGAADLASGVVLSWHQGRWFSHLEGWLIQPFAQDTPGMHYSAYPRGSLAAGYQLFDRASLIVQAQGGNSPYHSQINMLDHAPFLIAFGMRGALASEAGWSVTIVENITQVTTQDISIAFGLSWPM